ncbi:hypothetical protein [Streptomyces sp. NPDC058412]|uniref:hypothetical protein n=1 Tax=Streptomyces sp. NPDC058412 TaxID=3346486 RepID=UPI003668B65F
MCAAVGADLPAMGLVLAFTVIAVVNTLATYTAERFREFAMWGLARAKRRQVLRMARLPKPCPRGAVAGAPPLRPRASNVGGAGSFSLPGV